MNRKIVRFVLLAMTLQVLESYFPHPVAGVRLGLANFVSLLAVVYFGLNMALKVSILRTICASLFLGTFLSVSFILSFTAALVSSFVMWMVYKIFSKLKFIKLSVLSISIFGAVAHNFTQIFVVYLFFIRERQIFYLVPILIISGVITGTITGVIALSVIKKMDIEKFLSSEKEIVYTGNISTHTNFVKVILATIFLILFFIVNTLSWLVFIFVVLFLLTCLIVSRHTLFINIRRILWLLLCSFFIPLIFNRTGKVLLDLGFRFLTYEGVKLSLIYSLRIVNITLFSMLITQLYTKEELAMLFSKVLFFYKHSGEIITEILTTFPTFFDTVKNRFNKIKLNRKNFVADISQVISLVATLLYE